MATITKEQKKKNKIRPMSLITSQYGIATGNQKLTEKSNQREKEIIKKQRQKQDRQRITKGSRFFGKDINYSLNEDDKRKVNYILDRLEKKFPNMSVEKRRKSAIVKMKNNENQELTKEQREMLNFITEKENNLKQEKAKQSEIEATRQKIIQKVTNKRKKEKEQREAAAKERFNMMEEIIKGERDPPPPLPDPLSQEEIDDGIVQAELFRISREKKKNKKRKEFPGGLQGGRRTRRKRRNRKRKTKKKRKRRRTKKKRRRRRRKTRR